MENNDSLMSPKDRYKMEYLCKLKDKNKRMYDDILLYSEMQEKFIDNIGNQKYNNLACG